MIPKVIHYCWFGRGPIPARDQKCIESWKKFCPDYTIIQWNEDNYDISKNPYMKEAYDSQRWGFVVDYARMDIVYQHGGIYLDTDVELLRSLDVLLNAPAFVAMERGSNCVALGLGFGAEKECPLLSELCGHYQTLSFYGGDGNPSLKPNPVIITDYLRQFKGFCAEPKKVQFIDQVMVLPADYLCPMDYSSGKIEITENTYAIHHYHASWKTEEELKNMDEYRKTTQIFGKKLGEIVFGIYSCIKAEGLGCYLWNRIRKYIRKIIETN